MVTVVLFESGERVTADHHRHTIPKWSIEAIRQLIASQYDHWVDEHVTFSDPPTTCGESVELVSAYLAQAVLCGVEGGMIYVARC